MEHLFNVRRSQIFQYFWKYPERNTRGLRFRTGKMMPMAESKEDSYKTRSSLIRRARNIGDDRSWQEFNDVYGKLIFRFALKAGLTEDEAQEVVQETLIAAAKHLPGFRYDPRKCSFRTWLLNMSNWRIQDQFRKRRAPGSPRRAEKGSGEIADADRTAEVERVADPSTNGLEAIWDKEWRQTLLDSALAKIKGVVDAKHWQIFYLYGLKEWSAGEVAKVLRVSSASIYLVKHRISLLVRQEVKRLERELDLQATRQSTAVSRHDPRNKSGSPVRRSS
jgi:RNA polymerase sigma-70 factor (ECF subfamily)